MIDSCPFSIKNTLAVKIILNLNKKVPTIFYKQVNYGFFDIQVILKGDRRFVFCLLIFVPGLIVLWV
jgi:hypothetical protein